MDENTLKQTLAALHEALQRAPDLDEQSRQLLREIMSDIEGLEAATTVVPLTVRRHRLEALAVEFEAEHPNLAAGLRQLMDLLANSGL